MKAVFTGVVADGNETDYEEDYSVEDGGQARIQTFGSPPDDESGLFVRLQSWDEDKEHKDWQKLAGKKIRITVTDEPAVPGNDALNQAVNLLNEFYFDGPRTALHNRVFDFLQSIDRGPTIRRTRVEVEEPTP